METAAKEAAKERALERELTIELVKKDRNNSCDSKSKNKVVIIRLLLTVQILTFPIRSLQ